MMLCASPFEAKRPKKDTLTFRKRQDREANADYKNQITEARRQDCLNREEERWDAIEKKELHEIDRQRRLVDDGGIFAENWVF